MTHSKLVTSVSNKELRLFVATYVLCLYYITLVLEFSIKGAFIWIFKLSTRTVRRCDCVFVFNFGFISWLLTNVIFIGKPVWSDCFIEVCAISSKVGSFFNFLNLFVPQSKDLVCSANKTIFRQEDLNSIILQDYLFNSTVHIILVQMFSWWLRDPCIEPV